MFRPMFGKMPKHKSFDYVPRYYDPEKEKSRKDRIQFKPLSGRKRSNQGKSILFYALLLAMVVYIISVL